MPIIGNLSAGRTISGERFIGLQTLSKDPLVFRIKDFPEFPPREMMRITSDGTVGIGTRTPSETAGLHVDASIVQTDYAEKESEAISSVRMEYGGIHLYNNSGTGANGVISFKDDAADNADARIFYRNTYGAKGALMFEVFSSGETEVLEIVNGR